jgi:hypothetical protein
MQKWNSDSHRGDYEKYQLMRYETVQSDRSLPALLYLFVYMLFLSLPQHHVFRSQ